MNGRCWHFGLLSECREELFGVAILGVLIMHGFALYFPIPPSMMQAVIFKLCSVVYTQGFFFLSGIGLWFSWKRDSSLSHFYVKRMRRIFIPWALIALPLFFVLDCAAKRDFYAFILDVSTLQFWIRGNNGTWYVSVIVVLYLIFPAVCFVYSRFGALGYVCLNGAFVFVLVLMYHNHPHLFERLAGGAGILQALAFFCGVFVGELVEIKSPLKIFHIFGFGLVLAFLEISKNNNPIVSGCCDVAERIFLLSLLCVVLVRIKRSVFSSVLRFCGLISLELYLSHILLIPVSVRLFCLPIGGGLLNGSLKYSVIIISSFCISILANKAVVSKR